ncbi:MAG: hypothetical protein JWP94_949 [Mucilaginibacter sp.]|jgi:hypothetical protein|nr:hypothetical protein [Mucilaginibacter sp.]
MKKLILLLAIVAVGFSSCQKEYINNASSTQTLLFDVPSSAWVTYDHGDSYSVSINVPELTNYYNANGLVSVYISFGNGVYEQLPEVYNDISYSFTHGTGGITIDVQDMAHLGIPPPTDAIVKVVLSN